MIKLEPWPGIWLMEMIGNTIKQLMLHGGDGMGSSGRILHCAWCGKDLSNASCVTYLNGNQPICGLCLTRAKYDPVSRDWDTLEENDAWKDL